MSCGCCDCLTAARAVRVAPNRPGLSAIARRIGTHASLYERMIAALSAVDPDTGRAGSLAGLTTREKNDASLALLDAWAACGDVLAFYQERIANEGYLRTATERRSVLELGRLVGYTLQPGVAASSYAAYILEDGAATIIPAGSKVQSTPLLPGEEPQVFETAEDLAARGEWNLLRPRSTQPRPITLNTVRESGFRLYIEGVDHQLASGDALLFQFEDGQYAVAWLREVEVDHAAQRTAVTFHRIATATTRDPADTADPAPDTAISTVPEVLPHDGVEFLPAAVLQDPSVPPPTRFDVAPAYEERFEESSDYRFQIAGELVPHLRKLPAFLAGVARRKEPQLDGVWALRNKSAVFGYNAPAVITTVSGQVNDAAATFDAPKPDASEAPARVYLELPDDEITTGSKVVLVRGAKILVRNVLDVATLPRAVYGLSGKTTRLDLDGNWWLAAATDFGVIRTTTVLARSERLTVAWEPIPDPVGARWNRTDDKSGDAVLVREKTVALDAFLSGLTPGRWLIFSGERADLSGIQSTELAMIADVQHNGLGPQGGALYTNVILAGEGLAYAYKRDTLKIYGNVVKITHGESFTEILGNGDATQRLQSFPLRHAPLTWIPAANPAGVATTLQVRVHDVLVREVASLAEAGPADRVYVTRTAEDGTTTVTFGTGERGARLPTGTDNVRAVYRKSLGRAGNVQAGQINVPLTRVAGMREVTNPIAASGGADPESRDQARANVPLAVRALGRVVSVRDYEEFARTFAGIAKALAARPQARPDTVLLTIAGDGEMDVLETSDLHRSLVKALRRYGNPLQPLRVVNRIKVLLTGSARVQVLREYEWKHVAPKIRASLLDAFSFERRALLQPIFPGEVVSAIQRVEGVSWVDLDGIGGISAARLVLPMMLQPQLKLEPIVPPKPTFEEGAWLGAGLAYLPAALADAFLLQEVPNA